MKKYIFILFLALLFTGYSVDAQINPIKRPKQKPKTEKSSSPKQNKTNKKSKKQSAQTKQNTPNKSTASSKTRQIRNRNVVHSPEKVDQIIRELINNMVYVQVEGLRYGPNQYKKSNPFDKTGKSREPVQNFYICKFEVTQELWSAVMGYNPSSFSSNSTLQNPVENVTWEECQEFIYELNDLVRYGIDFRLPTEEEWEYAAKGGILSNGNKYSGSAAAQRVAWYDRNSNGTTHQVGTLIPNELGIFDMSGNVSEWCETLFDRHYDEDDLNATSLYYNPESRACRGGSWKDNHVNCTITSRADFDVDIEMPTIGLRLAASFIDPDE